MGARLMTLDGFARTGSLLAAWVYSQREGHARWAQIGGWRIDPLLLGRRSYDRATRTEIWDQLQPRERQTIGNWLLDGCNQAHPCR